MSANQIAEDEVKEYWTKLKSLILENQHISQLKPLADHINDLRREDVSSPFVNHVWRVYYEDKESGQRHSVVVKVANKIIKVLGPDMPYSTERLATECKVLEQFNMACPGSAPHVYLYSSANDMAIFEDLAGYETMLDQFRKGIVDLQAVKSSAEILAKFHNAHHSTSLSREAFQSLVEEYIKEDEYKEKLIQMLFEECIDIQKVIKRGLMMPAALPIAVEALGKEEFQNKIRQTMELMQSQKECLIHRDFGIHNLMCNNGTVKVVDCEAARVGPIAIDVGRGLMNLTIQYHAHKAQMKTAEKVQHHREAANKVIDCCYNFLSTYLEHMTCAIGDRDDYVRQLMSDTAAMAGADLIFMNHYLGSAFRDIALSDEVAIQVEEAAINLIQNSHNIHTIEELLQAASLIKV